MPDHIVIAQSQLLPHLHPYSRIIAEPVSINGIGNQTGFRRSTPFDAEHGLPRFPGTGNAVIRPV